MTASAALLRAYRMTRYAIGETELRIGRRSQAADTLLRTLRQQHGILRTAWNPRSRRMPDGWNVRMQHRLRSHLRRCLVLAADGRWRRWREAHLCVLSSPRPCLRLAHRFRQRAIVVLTLGQPVRLMVLG